MLIYIYKAIKLLMRIKKYKISYPLAEWINYLSENGNLSTYLQKKNTYLIHRGHGCLKDKL